MQTYEFVIPGRPLSVQVRRKASRRRWTETVKLVAIRNSPGTPPFTDFNARVTIVFLCGSARIDADNVIKPIQDALTGVWRIWTEAVDADQLPPLLRTHWVAQQDCVYIRVDESRRLEELL